MSQLLEQFIREKDIPTWYRELSDRQMSAADYLLNAIRDDSNQGTTHRVCGVLERIGISPIIKDRQIKITMRMSQGNDLAFLWFLLELFYAENVHGIHLSDSIYTVNQQLILSTICHLDMITTLRELDKILPQQSKKVLNNGIKKPTKIINRKKSVRKYINPYLQPLHKAQLPQKKCITLVEPKVKITPYEHYADPVYIVQNEANRWFADVNLDLSQVIGKTLSSMDVVRSLLNNQIDNMELGDGEMITLKNLISMCPTHQERERKRFNKMLVDAKNRCIRYYLQDYKNNKKIVLKRKFQEQLKIELEKVKEFNQELWEKFDTAQWFRFMIHDIVDSIKANNDDEKNVEDDDALSIIEESNENLCIKSYFNFGHFGKPKPRERYFEAPKEHTPYKFDYPKIFNIHDLQINDNAEKHIRTSVETALNVRKYPDEDEAINNWLHNTWIEEVQESNRNYRQKKREIKHKKNTEIDANKYYDPKDVKLMRDLLKTALHEMSKNPKFVLASIPDVHKLAILNNWIQARFGLIIKEKTRLKALRKTHDILDLMDKAKMKIKIPTLDEISHKKVLNYNSHDKVKKKVQEVVQSFYMRTKIRILEDVRIYWAALEPYHCKNGPPRETFYAYMPSKIHDILPFRPWQTFQYRDFKRARERRGKI